MKNYVLTLKSCFSFNKHKNASTIFKPGVTLVYVHLEKFVYSGQYRFIAEVSEIEALYFLVNSRAK